MGDISVRDFIDADADAVLALNAHSVHFLAPMDKGRLTYLRENAKLFWVVEQVGEVVAFFIGFIDGSVYDSPNYTWFARRLKNFLYIDRIVVSEKARGLGIGRKLYAKIEAWARAEQLTSLTAEIDIQPANPVSLKFHQVHNFIELHQQQPQGTTKIVSLQAKFL